MGCGREVDIDQLKHVNDSSHYWIVKLLNRGSRPLSILDVGGADGYLGAILKKQGHHVIGVEADPARAKKAMGSYDRVHLADIETFDFPYLEEFDLILFADVLEHLREPSAVLRRALPCLKQNGEIIVSVPNVANFIIRIGLLLGRFEYTDRGILDRTHLRFFTLASLRRMLTDDGWAIVEIRVTPLPVQLVMPATDKKIFLPLHEVHYGIVRLWKTVFAYQFVVRALRTSSNRGA
ncbi:MAG: hypothetical protein QOF64_2426 [Candidatus Binatota bacterium]|nr:hypothetical protein [Candidatus Binatota bacterium]